MSTEPLTPSPGSELTPLPVGQTPSSPSLDTSARQIHEAAKPIVSSSQGSTTTPMSRNLITTDSNSGIAPVIVEQKLSTAPDTHMSGRLLGARVDHDTAPDSQETVPRARREDFFLWTVITLVLGYLAWYLNSATSAFARISDIELLAVYGMNIRESLVLLIGGALAFMGCMIVLRRVRMSFAALAQFETTRARIVADSAGVVVVMLGVLLLGIVVTHSPRVERSGGVAPTNASTSGLEERLHQIKLKQETETVAQPGKSTDGGVE